VLKPCGAAALHFAAGKPSHCRRQTFTLPQAVLHTAQPLFTLPKANLHTAAGSTSHGAAALHIAKGNPSLIQY